MKRITRTSRIWCVIFPLMMLAFVAAPLSWSVCVGADYLKAVHHQLPRLIRLNAALGARFTTDDSYPSPDGAHVISGQRACAFLARCYETFATGCNIAFRVSEESEESNESKV